jgi:diguanylate cyclase (GGDEF)-like protein
MEPRQARGNMAVFLSTQLDFIFFLYGLAFILLGAVCFAIMGVPGRSTSFGVLGAFAVAHGLSEWLDLMALLVGDVPSFAVARTLLMAGSFLLLLEFARWQALQLGLRVPGPWALLVLALLVALGWTLGGLSAANATARYMIGFVSAMATAWVLVRTARAEPAATQQAWIYAAAGFGMYAVAAGLIVPAAHFWPANVVNQPWFTSLTGMPIQLVRGALACWIAVALWVIWKRMVAADVGSTRYTVSQQHILVWTLLATGAIIGLGWTLTQFLGGIYQRNVEEESAGDIHLLASLLDRETSMLGGMAEAVAGMPSVLPLVTGASRHDAELAQSALDLEVGASGAKAAYVMDASGTVVASSGARDSVAAGPPKSVSADGGYQFAVDGASGTPDYYASRPVLDPGGSIVGAAVLVKSLDSFKADLSGFNRSYFLVDAAGVVMVTNRADMSLRSLWPQPAAAGPSIARPMAEREIQDATWINVQGQRHYVRRRFAAHSRWSIVLLMPDSRVYASRFLGIIITLLVSIMMMIYLYGRERLIRDRVELESRLNLRDVARDLRLQATTDPLTGLFNRLKFNEALSSEIARSKRQKTPLSLMLYDVDHFKAINDSHGHQVGDAVLVQISQWALQHIRPSDLLARWGGEEFIILAPGSDGQMAYQVADRLRSAMQLMVFEKVGSLSCSFGVAQYVDGDSAETMLARADAALYRAKVGGRNRVELAT